MAIKIPYGQAMTDFLYADTIVGANFMDGKAATYKMNPLTRMVEGVKFDKMDVAIPAEGPYQHMYRQMIDHNTNLRYLAVISDFVIPPLADGAFRIFGGIFDVLTLGIFRFGKHYEKRSETMLAEIMDTFKNEQIKTKKQIPVLGVPKESMPGGPGAEVTLPGPYPGFNGGRGKEAELFEDDAYKNALLYNRN